MKFVPYFCPNCPSFREETDAPCDDHTVGHTVVQEALVVPVRARKMLEKRVVRERELRRGRMIRVTVMDSGCQFQMQRTFPFLFVAALAGAPPA